MKVLIRMNILGEKFNGRKEINKMKIYFNTIKGRRVFGFYKYWSKKLWHFYIGSFLMVWDFRGDWVKDMYNLMEREGK